MQASPQRQHRSPGYPTRLEINADPALLREHLPATWSTRPELAAASSLLLTLAFAACQTPPATGGTKPPSYAASGPAIVAPLFEHMDGYGAIGCVIVSPSSSYRK